MKKIILSSFALASFAMLNAQTSVQPIVKNHMTDFACYDDFKDGNKDVAGVNDYSAEDKNHLAWDDVTNKPDTKPAYKGMYWTGDGKPGKNGFTASRERKADSVHYKITQTDGAYEPFLMVFGAYTEGAGVNATRKEYTVDLSKNANVSFDVVNKGDKTIRFSVQLQDTAGNSLVFMKEVLGNEANEWQYNIGFNQRSGDAPNTPLEPGQVGKFNFDFKNAVTGCEPGSLVGGEGSCSAQFYYNKVKAITFTAVNHSTSQGGEPIGIAGCKEWCPFEITNYPISITNFKMGNQNLVGLKGSVVETATFTAYPNPATDKVSFGKELTNVSVLDATGNVVETLDSAKEINTSSYSAGMYLIKADQGTVKVVVE
jgi:hypothetical protein